ncbi:glycerophosphodiester phosphodiesterase family protein [Thalassotalea sp. PS06]|uniref:glycerophosphodiester phosphodiesterase family protein n=1 Tax=Thalassotalea sp. PS06 TaxID=2594005 RepID=UPI0011623D19|nr:glycerophosphodiester phosphodiesterase family protein [Thalassotalea sp. PS06]QDP00358.1 hypothetical protein FNC98_02725 [Thalassotalea sp. PS06]
MFNNISLKLLILSSFGLSLILYSEYQQIKDRNIPIPESEFPVFRIAHAGGNVGGQSYTNSIQALEVNAEKSFKYFEIDFSFTKDDQLVCLHNWTSNFEDIFGYRTKEKLTLEEFNYLLDSKKGRFQNCTLESLSYWMKKYPDTILVTDAKERNLEALTMIFNSIPHAADRVIPQIYNPEDFYTVREIGFNYVIWTLYKFKEDDKTVLSWAKQFDNKVAVTMPLYRANTTLPKELNKLNIPSYSHTINDLNLFKYLQQKGISEIYTDIIQPSPPES